MSDIEFVDQIPGEAAPNSLLNRQRLREFADAVRKQPGRWAIYPYPTTDLAARAAASRINRGKIAAFGDRFEAMCSHGVVYVRFLGEEQ